MYTAFRWSPKMPKESKVSSSGNKVHDYFSILVWYALSVPDYAHRYDFGFLEYIYSKFNGCDSKILKLSRSLK